MRKVWQPLDKHWIWPKLFQDLWRLQQNGYRDSTDSTQLVHSCAQQSSHSVAMGSAPRHNEAVPLQLPRCFQLQLVIPSRGLPGPNCWCWLVQGPLWWDPDFSFVVRREELPFQGWNVLKWNEMEKWLKWYNNIHMIPMYPYYVSIYIYIYIHASSKSSFHAYVQKCFSNLQSPQIPISQKQHQTSNLFTHLRPPRDSLSWTTSRKMLRLQHSKPNPSTSSQPFESPMLMVPPSVYAW